MRDRLTREELLRRAAFGARTALDSRLRRRMRRRQRRRKRPARRSLPKRCASRTGRSTSTSTRRRRSGRTLEEFKQKFGVKVDYTEDINSNSEYFGKIQGPLSRGQSIDRDHRRPHRQRALPLDDDRQGLGREARQGRDPEHQQPRRRPAAPRLRPRPRVQPAVAVGYDRHRLQREADEADHVRSTSSSRTRSSRAR